MAIKSEDTKKHIIEIRQLLKPSWKTIQTLLSRRNENTHLEHQKKIDDDINSIINDINSLEIHDKKISAKQIRLGRVESLSSFMKADYFKKYHNKAGQCLLEGKYVPQFIFAGGATRFGFGTMWGLDLSEVCDKLLNHKGASYGDLSIKEYKKAIKLIRKNRSTINSVNIGMGPRQLLQYYCKLASIAQKYEVPVSSVIEKTKMIINLNRDTAEQSINSLVKNKHYGFKPENIYILVQPSYKGCSFINGHFIEDRRSDALPFGHGYATMQMFQTNEAFTVSASGKKSLIKKALFDILGKSDCEVICSHRINDMTKWTDSIVDENKLAYSLYLIENGRNDMIVELVENPHDQKGGFWLKANGKCFLAETLSMSRPDIKSFIDGLKNVPYNAFRNIYSVKRINERKGLLKIKKNLRYRSGSFYIETVSGDLSMVLGCAAFSKKGEVIHDIKNISNFVEEGIDFICRQNKNKMFYKIAKKFQA